MLPGDRRIGGLWCSEVLEQLSEYLDGWLPPDTIALVQGHVAECDRCAKFGTDFAVLVTTLREQHAPEALDAGVAERLRRRLAGRA